MSGKWVVVLLGCAIASSAFSQNIDRSSYYLVDGRRVAMTAAHGLAAVEFPDGLQAESAPIENDTVKELRAPRLNVKYRMRLFEPQEGVDDAVFDDWVRRYVDRERGSDYRAVTRVNGGFAVATGEYTIEFSRRTDKLEVADFLARSAGLSVSRFESAFDIEQLTLKSNDREIDVPWKGRRFRLVRLQKEGVEIGDLNLSRDDNVLEFINDLVENRGTKAQLAIDRSEAEPLMIVSGYPRLIQLSKVSRDYLLALQFRPVYLPPVDCPKPVKPNDTLYADQWPLRNDGSNATGDCSVQPPLDAVCDDSDVDADEGWELQGSANGKVIAVVDLGVDQNHDDLKNILVGPGEDATGDGEPQPKTHNDRHGTWVAGVAAAESDNCLGITGIAPEAKVLSVRMGEIGSGDVWVVEPDVPGDAIYLALDREADVIVNSWVVLTNGNIDRQHLNNAIRYAVEKDKVVIFAAGNIQKASDCWSYIDDANKNDCWSDVDYPANIADSTQSLRERLIVVSATNQKDEFKTVRRYVGHEPDTGGNPTLGSRHGCEVTLSAPGSGQPTTDHSEYPGGSGYIGDFRGTSAAAPLVGGAAALLLARYPGASPKMIRSWLIKGADRGAGQEPIDPLGNDDSPVRDQFYGAGRLNLRGAIEAADAEMCIVNPSYPQCF